MTAHLSAHSGITFHVIIAADDIGGTTLDCGFKYHIVIRISTDGQLSVDRHKHRSRCGQTKTLRDVVISDLLFSLQSRSTQHIVQFFEEGQGNDDGEMTLNPSLNETSGHARRIEQRGNPDVGIKQRDGLHGAWLAPQPGLQ